MASVYPSSVQTFIPKVDNQDPVIAADINSVFLEVTAIEGTLGASPSTTPSWSNTSFDTTTTVWSTVSSRITNLERGIVAAYTDRVKTSGGSSVSNGSSVALTLQGASGASANLLEVKDSGGTVRSAFNAAGYLVGINGGTP